MKTSCYGIAFIETNEGLRLTKYQDIVGRWTIGYGHLITPTDNLPDTITLDQAHTLLIADVEHVELFLTHCYPGLYQNEFDAMVDFGFNLGIGALHEMLGHGVDQVPVQILKWDHAAGKVVTGLLERRQRELNLWDQDNHD